jgi:hypothetical protein
MHLNPAQCAQTTGQIQFISATSGAGTMCWSDSATSIKNIPTNTLYRCDIQYVRESEIRRSMFRLKRSVDAGDLLGEAAPLKEQ